MEEIYANDCFFYKIFVFENDEYYFLLGSGLFNVFYLNSTENFEVSVFFESKVYVDRLVLIKMKEFFKYPLIIKSTDSLHWIYAKCGKEEIIQKNSKLAFIHFHEFCLTPEIWIFANHSQISFYFSFMDSLDMFVRKTRLFLISAGFGLFLIENKKNFLIVSIFFYFFHKEARNYGLCGLDHVHLQDNDFLVSEVLLIFLFGFVVSVILGLLYKIMNIIINKIPVFRYKYLFIASFGIFLWP